jgi:RNA polymerase sigma factor (sigma-70 family)
MVIDNNDILTGLEQGNHDKVVALCEPIRYYYLHKTNFWNLFTGYRDDFLQEGRIAILKCINAYDYRGRFTTFVHTAIRNALYSFVKKMDLFGNMKNIDLKDDITYDDLDESCNVKALTLIDELMDSIHLHKHKDILHPYFLDGKTQTEVAKDLGVSQQWVNIVVNNFKKEVKELYGIE